MAALKPQIVAIATMSALLAGLGFAPGASADAVAKKEMIHKCLLQIYLSQRRKEAGTEFQALLALNPKDGQTNYEYGNWLLRGQQFKEALAHYKVATQLQPRNADYFAGYGAVLLHLGSYDPAVAAYRHAVECSVQGQNFSSQYNTAVQYAQHAKQQLKYNQMLKEQQDSQ